MSPPLLLLEYQPAAEAAAISTLFRNLQNELVFWRTPPDEPGPSTRPTVAQDFTMLQIRGGDKFLSVVKPLEAICTPLKTRGILRPIASPGAAEGRGLRVRAQLERILESFGFAHNERSFLGHGT